MAKRPPTANPRANTAAIACKSAALLAILAAAGCSLTPPPLAGSPGAPAPGGPSAMKAQVSLDIAARERAAGDNAEAIHYYRIVLALNTSLSEQAYVGLADTLLATGDNAGAAENARQAVALSPRDPQARTTLGVALVGLDQPVQALNELLTGIALAPSARAYRAMAIAHNLLGEPLQAVADCQAGLAQFPADPGLHQNLGLSQALAGDFNGAVATMQTAAAAPAATGRDRLNLALVLGLAGRNTEAAQAAANDLDPVSIQSNLAYYAELRALPVQARAIALLSPADLPAVPQIRQSEPAPLAISPAPTPPVTAAPLAAPTSLAPQASLQTAPPRSAPLSPPTGAQVQLGTLYSDQDAEAEWRRLAAKMPTLLEGHHPRIINLAANDTQVFLLRTDGFSTAGEAGQFCQDITAAGGTCLVK